MRVRAAFDPPPPPPPPTGAGADRAPLRPPPPPPPLRGGGSRLRQPAPPLRHRSRITRPRRATAAKFFHAMRQVDITAAKSSLGEPRRNVRRERARTLARRIHHHARE